ncbi:MAG: hypothetical protein ACYSUX_03760 [Planctomycetota bacterium]|jgi:hypothetical protein
MNNKGKILSFSLMLVIILLFSDTGISLIIVGGDEPTQDHGWPSGCVETANLTTRFGWWEGPPFGGGEYHFLYRCDNTDQFNQALEKFAAIDAKRLELVVHNGPKKDFMVDGRVDWTFLAWVPKNWDSLNNMSRNFYRPVDSDSKKPVPMAKKIMPALRIDVYLGGENPIAWEDVKIPENLVVIDRRPRSVSSELAGKGLVRGKVFDLVSKKPITGARVMLYKRILRTGADIDARSTPRSSDYEWKKAKSSTTNSEGLCQIDQIPLGLYEISVTADDYVPIELDRYDNSPAECYEFEVGLLRPFTIKGIVTDINGIPLSDVGVSADEFIGPGGNKYRHKSDSPVLTDAQGRFEIPDLPKGFAKVRCRAEGLHQDDSIFEMYPIPCKEIKLTMSGTGIIRGKVIDTNGEVPSRDVHVHMRPPGEQIGKWGGSMKCKEDGTFEFKGVPPGEYLVGSDPMLLIEGNRKNTKLITVEAGKVYDVEIVHVAQKRKR